MSADPVAMAPVRHVAVPEMPEPPTATWSNCLVVGNDIIMSGVTANPAIDQYGKDLSTYDQANRVMSRIASMLEAAGGKVSNIYKLVIYVTDIEDKAIVSKVREAFFQRPYPCSTLVEVSQFTFPNLTIEVDAFARLDCDLGRARTQSDTHDH